MNHLGIITPLIPEAKCFTNYPVKNRPIQLGDGISLIVSGEGPDCATSAAQSLIEQNVDGILITGMAGALVQGLNPGDIVLPEKVYSNSNEAFICPQDWIKSVLTSLNSFNVRISTGPLYTASKIINSIAEKEKINQSCQAVAVDMETAAVFEYTKEMDVPCLGLRTIIDPAEYTFPDFIIKLVNQYGEIPLPGLIFSALMNPHKIGSLYKLMGYYRRSSRVLRKIARHPSNLLMLNN